MAAEISRESDPVRLRYLSLANYRQTFGHLLVVDDIFNREVSESRVEEDVTIKWSTIGGRATAVIKTGISVTKGEKVVVSNATVLWEKVASVKEVLETAIGSKLVVDFGNTGHVARVHHLTTGFKVMMVHNPVPFHRQMAALQAGLATAPVFLQDLLVHGQVDKIPDTSLPPLPSTVSTPQLDPLNKPQEYALKSVLKKRFSLIQGPPGTGKTVTTAHLVRLLKALELGSTLVTAPSNAAADQLATKLLVADMSVVRVYARMVEDGPPGPLQKNSLHHLLHDEDTDSPQLKELKEEKKTKEIKVKYETLQREKEKSILSKADVVVTTVVGAGDKRLEGINFKSVVVDEATMLTEPESLVTLARPSEFYLLVGDQEQLGPVVQCGKARSAGLGQSLFLRLSLLGLRPHRLEIQYRMHPDILELPNKMVYNDFISSGVDASDRFVHEELTSWLGPILFYHVSGKEEKIGNSFVNDTEVAAVDRFVTAICQAGVSPSNVGVITPYSGQRSSLLNYFSNTGTMRPDVYKNILVGPVESFQGLERDYIILSTVRANTSGELGFLGDCRRLNVALTRAKRSLIIVGDSALLASHEEWGKVVSHFHEKKCLVEGPLQSLQQSTAAAGIVPYIASSVRGPAWSLKRQIEDEKATAVKKQRMS